MPSSQSDRDAGHLPDAVRSLADPVAEPLGAELLDVEVKGQRGRRIVRITADVMDLDAAAGLDIETIATLSRRIGKALEDEDLIAGAYTLEVTSPGADRPLRTARDFVRNVGREVRIHRSEDVDQPQDATAELTGIVVAATEDEIVLDHDGDEIRVSLADVDHGKVVLPW